MIMFTVISICYFFFHAKKKNNQNLLPNVHMAKFELQIYWKLQRKLISAEN